MMGIVTVFLCFLAWASAFQRFPSAFSSPLAAAASSVILHHPLTVLDTREQTYVMIKPDAVQRHLVGEIISRFERKRLQLKAMRMTVPTRAVLELHYAEHKNKPFFPDLVSFMTSGPVVAMVWEGKNAVNVARTMLGTTNPATSPPGTIRGDFGLETEQNVCHASDSVQSAMREISVWFPSSVCDADVCTTLPAQ